MSAMLRRLICIAAVLWANGSLASDPAHDAPEVFILATGRHSASPLNLHVWTDGRIDCFERGGLTAAGGDFVVRRFTYHDPDAPLRLLADLLNAGVHLWPSRPMNAYGVSDGPTVSVNGMGWKIVGAMPERAEWDVVEGRSPWADRWCAALNAIEAMPRDDVEGVEVKLRDAMKR